MDIIFRVSGYATYLICGLWGLILSLRIVADQLGDLLAFVAFFFLPITIALAPWFDAFSNGNWLAVQVVYGGWIFAMLCQLIASLLEDH